MKNYEGLYSQPFLCFFLNFLLFVFPSPDRILTLLIFTALQVFPVNNSDPFLDSHNRKAGWLNRFSVAPSASAYLVHWLLCNCYYFEKKNHFFLICTLRLYRRLFPIEVYSYQDVFLLFYK